MNINKSKFKKSLVKDTKKFRKLDLEKIQETSNENCFLINNIYRYLFRDDDGSIYTYQYEKKKEPLDLRDVESQLELKESLLKKNGGKRRRTRKKKNRKNKKSKNRKNKKSKNRK